MWEEGAVYPLALSLVTVNCVIDDNGWLVGTQPIWDLKATVWLALIYVWIPCILHERHSV